MSKIYYHLRPNKSIDRMLFFELLLRLNRYCHIPDYQYIGFGSWTFEDFKLLHRQLGICDMVSLETNDNVFKRQNFNVPFKCIELVKKTSKDYFTDDFNRTKPVIIWLDHTDPRKLRDQIDEFCGLLGKLEAKDIVRLTLNAHPSTLYTPAEGENNENLIRTKQLEKLKERIGDYLPSPIHNSCVTRQEYPKTLLFAIGAAIRQLYSPGRKRILPLSSYVYADGQQMLTFTGIVVESDQEETEIKENIRGWELSNTNWDTYFNIAIPPLTPKERITLNEKLPCNDIEELCGLFDYTFESSNTREDIDNYIKYYRYYPNYHQVIF